MRHSLLIVAAVLLAGCHAMQATPTAPSAVIPAGPTVGPRIPTYTAFDVALANGTDSSAIFAGNTWLGILRVQPQAGALITIPARIAYDCGNGQASALPPGRGNEMRVSCLFATPGTYTVRVTVESQNGVTTSAELPVTVRPQPADLTPAGVNIEAAINPDGSSAHSQAWTFIPTVTGRIVTLTWDFGDGSSTLTTGPTQVMNHLYTRSGVYVVTATPRLEDGSTRPSGRTEILVTGI